MITSGPLTLSAQASSQTLAAAVDELVAALKPRRNQREGAASEDSLSSLSGDTHHI